MDDPAASQMRYWDVVASEGSFDRFDHPGVGDYQDSPAGIFRRQVIELGRDSLGERSLGFAAEWASGSFPGELWPHPFHLGFGETCPCTLILFAKSRADVNFACLGRPGDHLGRHTGPDQIR
jgi:hypothetical protein